VRRKPYSVVLLDEIEKAHPEVFNILLQIMDDGRLTDAKGRKVDFRNTIIIMTSNAGAELIRRETGLGFHKAEGQQSAQEQYDKMKDKVLQEMKKLFRPEFLNRIDASVVFRALGRVQIREIIDLQLGRTQKQLTEQRLTMEVSEGAKDLLMDKGFDPVFGARPMRRAIQNLIEDPLAEGLLHGRFQPGDVVKVDRSGDDLTLETRPGVAAPEPEKVAAEASTPA
jgi:ATP-dependent Clp protease ATP-binding subunit ClpC